MKNKKICSKLLQISFKKLSFTYHKFEIIEALKNPIYKYFLYDNIEIFHEPKLYQIENKVLDFSSDEKINKHLTFIAPVKAMIYWTELKNNVGNILCEGYVVEWKQFGNICGFFVGKQYSSSITKIDILINVSENNRPNKDNIMFGPLKKISFKYHKESLTTIQDTTTTNLFLVNDLLIIKTP